MGSGVVAKKSSLIRISREGQAPLVCAGRGSSLQLISFGTAGQQVRRTVVESRWMHGNSQTSAVLEETQVTAVIRAGGASWAAAQAWAAHLFAAAAQFSFTITEELDGVTRVWRCQTADVTLVAGDVLDKVRYFRNEQEYQLVAPAYPIPGGA